MTACGYCGAPVPRGRREDQVHGIDCPFVPERERRVRQKLAELEERIKQLEASLLGVVQKQKTATP